MYVKIFGLSVIKIFIDKGILGLLVDCFGMSVMFDYVLK